jgi:aquaporin Z
MAYAIGHISGCHINPAVTLAMAITRKIPAALVPVYWVAQLAGAAAGGFIIWGIAHGRPSFDSTSSDFAANFYNDSGFGLGAAILVEIVFTALLVFVVLTTTGKRFPAGFGGLAAGITLALIHLVTIPVDNTSVNPARSFGAAIFGGGDVIKQLWAFIVFPLIGAVVGVFVWLFVDDARLEDTMLNSEMLRDVRDAGDRISDRAIEQLDG